MNNHILTAAHVVTNAEKILIRFENGEEAYATVVEKSSTVADLALLKINTKPAYAKPVKLAKNEQIHRHWTKNIFSGLPAWNWKIIEFRII